MKSIYGEDENIEFLGRQIVIGDSRLDLLFQIENIHENEYIDISRTFIVVELKFRNAEPKDVAQLSRYMNLLRDLEFDSRIGGAEVSVNGILLTTGLNSDMQEIQMYLNSYENNNIIFAEIQTKLNYQVDNYSRKEEYIQRMNIDNRLRKTKGVKECGEEKND